MYVQLHTENFSPKWSALASLVMLGGRGEMGTAKAREEEVACPWNCPAVQRGLTSLSEVKQWGCGNTDSALQWGCVRGNTDSV